MEKPQIKADLEIFIIGAGLGGLMMGLLLEQIGVKYHIFERAAEVKPLGSAMLMVPQNFPALEQLGIYEELKKISEPLENICFYQSDCKPIGTMSIERMKNKFGYPILAYSRPDFYDILRKRVPTEKISFKKKILKTEEKEGKVIIHCSDNTSYTGDILIGADGAYSGVRQSLYKHMESKGLLPESDLQAFSVGYTIVVGLAKGDPKKHPMLEETRRKFCQVLFNGNSNCYIVTLPNNDITWGLGTQLSREESKNLLFRSSEWNEESSESTIKPFRDFPSPTGGTMGDIFDATPKELTSKVFLEEKLFKTWHHGRTVLMGDAIHKLHPAGGQGASNALLDAIVLANCLYAMKDNSEKSIHAAFKDYYDQRFEFAADAFKYSTNMSNILNGQKFVQNLMRKVLLNYVPTWVFDQNILHLTSHRPQVSWLPLVKNRGTVKINPQKFKSKFDTNADSQ
ncbi:hypothetical protein BGZ76_002699 [Entomortierella beljakovae]|nr:hypothetical protein BGZ76_002699 [Entomortierella beljakovae]